MLEVYRPIWTPDGTPLLLETYMSYDDVETRATNLWRGFAGIIVTCMLLLIVFLLPILWRLLDRLNAAQDQRVALLEHTVNVSDRRASEDRLHPPRWSGELAAVSFVAAGEAERAAADGRADSIVVVLTSFSDQNRVTEALRAGAVGYLLKDSDPRDLLAAVRNAANGHAPLDPRVARALLPGAESDSPSNGLSVRETQVLRLVASGLANKQLGRKLGISERTVKAHLGRIFRQIRDRRAHQRSALGTRAP